MTNNNQNTDYPQFLEPDITAAEPDNARFHILPVPYEASVSYGTGTALGPRKIIEASVQLEEWDGKSTPYDKGIYTHDPVETDADAPTVMANIASAIKGIITRGGFPIAIGGEHSVTYGVIKGLIDAGISNFGVVQIDAHADLRDSYEDNRYSHASAMKRIIDEGIPLFQLGVRAFCEEEIETRKKYGVHYLDADDLVPNNQCDFQLPDDFPDNVFFTLDIDGMDPSIFPSTGTPVPGGLLWYQTLSLFESVARQRNIIGFDLMEFAPIDGFHAYEFSAAFLLYKMMGIVERNT